MTEKLSFYHLINTEQINKKDIELICNLAKKYSDLSKRGTRVQHDNKDLVLASLFFEASTRTRFSFESAMHKLGGKILSLEQGQSSSTNKGESLSDMGRVMSCYADLIVMRHSLEGSVAEFAKYSSVPVINAGDGVGHHPSQSLLDIYTILSEKKSLDNLTIGLVGDLKYGRTVRSLLTLLSYYSNNKIILISHDSLKYNVKKLNIIKSSSCKVIETTDLAKYIADLDVLYVTRIQKERFSDLAAYEQVKNNYHINKDIIKDAKKDMIIMHPLPRVNEISPEVDELPNAKYFQQAQNGLFVRMALLNLIAKA
jgi:aspartate carbamoyltransferase catalytic subunit